MKTDETRQCNICLKILPVTEFGKSKKSIIRRCKPCVREVYKKRILDKEYKEKLAEQRANNHVKNKEKYNERHKHDFQKNKENIYIRRKQYYHNNPDKMLAELHRQHIRNIFKSGGKAPELLGCDNIFLKKWFEFHFSIDTDMSIQNHGSYWHIDHVIPIKLWDLNDLDQQKLCFNWKNLMPLKAPNNISKNDRIDMVQINEQNRRLKLFSQIMNVEYQEISHYMAKHAIAGTP